jgi:hydroxymethylbilane synthase
VSASFERDSLLGTQRTTLRLATRGSELALIQTRIVADLLTAHDPGTAVTLVTVTTAGDANRAAPISALGDGAFVRGVEAALLDGRADIAVHSAKDIPTTEPPGLTLAAFPERGDPRDVLVSRDGRGFAGLSRGARLGTSSPRRAAIARSLRPDLEILPVRGNVDTRLRKLQAGEYDALVLAAAGLSRLGRLDEVTEVCDPLVWMPAAGQGVLGVQCRAGDPTERIVAAIDHSPTRAAITAERAVLRRLGSGCRTPVGAYARVIDGRLTLRGVLISPDGRRTVIAEREGQPDDGVAIGVALAEDLIGRGGNLYRLEG